MSSDIEHWLINATVVADSIEEVHYVSDPSRNIRKQQTRITWQVEQLLGRGGFGEVRVHRSFQGGKSKFRAVKRVSTASNTLQISECEKEMKALLEFSKPKYKEAAVFVEFYGWFKHSYDIYLAMEFLPLGDLENNIPVSLGKIPEPEARDITEQILSGLEIMHAEKFAHRDLKPQNVLVCNGSPKWWIKLADFGLSKRLIDGTQYHTRSGTQAYMAPEMLNLLPGVNEANYTNAVDLWATGCIIYRLILGTVPFPPGPSLMKYCEDNSFSSLNTTGLSSGALGLIRALLATNPRARPSASKAMESPWIAPIIVNSSSSPNADMGSRLFPISPTGNQPRAQFRDDDHIDLSRLTIYEDYNTISHAGLKTPSLSPAGRSRDESIYDGLNDPTFINRPMPRDFGEDSWMAQLRRETDEQLKKKTKPANPIVSGPIPGEINPTVIYRPAKVENVRVDPEIERLRNTKEKLKSIEQQQYLNDKLLWATSNEEDEYAVGSILDEGADVNIPDERMMTPLHWAAKKGPAAVVQLLLARGADVRPPDVTGWTPLQLSSNRGHMGDITITRMLIQKGADVNTCTKTGWAPLLHASYNGNIALAKLLLENGADKNAANTAGWTPLLYASYKGHTALVRLILESGANVNSIESEGMTALDHAASKGFTAIARLLIESGADVNNVDLREWRPLHHASNPGHTATARLLIENGAGVNNANLNGRTALYHCSSHGFTTTVQVLLDNGADTSLADSGGLSPLHAAATYGHVHVVKQLIDNGANINSLSLRGKTPLDLATRENRMETATLLSLRGGKRSRAAR